MLLKNKKTLTLTSLVILLPLVVGVLLWNRLPREMTIQWNFNGQPSDTASRGFVVFGMPLTMLAIQWFSILATALDPKNRGQNQKPLKRMLWVIPVLSNLVIGLMYAVSLGEEISPVGVIIACLGLMFVVIGNYLPKCRQNSTLGLRCYWTLSSEENWNSTHRFAGKVWVIGGILMMLLAFLPANLRPWLFLAEILVLIALPLIHSYRYFRKEKGSK